MGERDVKWENNQATWGSWKPKAQGNRGYQAYTAEKMVTHRIEKGRKRCQLFCAQSMELESSAIFNPKSAVNAKQIAPQSLLKTVESCQGPWGLVRK